MYLYIVLNLLYHEKLQTNQKHACKKQNPLHICLTSPGMGMGGKHFRTILGLPMPTNYVVPPHPKQKEKINK